MIGTTFPLLSLVVSILLLVWKPWRIGQRERGLPPGPPTKPIIGNATQIPAAFPHFKFTEWARAYGEIFSLKVLHQTFVILSSPRAVKEILDKQGLKTADRLYLYITTRVEKDYIAVSNASTHVWKTSRKELHTLLNSDALDRHLPTQQVEFAQFLNDILESPQNIYSHAKRTMASTMVQLVFGKRLPRYEGTVERIFHAIRLWNEVLDPTAHPPLDLLPFLKYIPSRWAPWKNLCRRAFAVRREVYGGLFDECERGVRAGKRNESYLEHVLLNESALDMNKSELKSLTAALLDAGIQTTLDSIHILILSFVNYPDCQRKAQAEIDGVIGRDRLPTIEDFPNLPYLDAYIKEVFRFRPIIPIGFPHVASADVGYNDYVIPKGATIILNLWGIYNDPDLFERPDLFQPERYLRSEFGTRTDTEVDTEGFRHSLPFGAGRRICPGMDMALRTIAINAMNLLWAFTFSKDDSGTGNLDFDAFLKPGIELTPVPFTCQVDVRDEKTGDMIKDWYSQALAQQDESM